MTSPDQPLNKKRKRGRPRKKSLPGCDTDEIQGPPRRGVDEKHMYTTPPSILLKLRSASKTQSTKGTGAISTTPPSVLSKLRSASKTQPTKATGAISTTPPSILSKLRSASKTQSTKTTAGAVVDKGPITPSSQRAQSRKPLLDIDPDIDVPKSGSRKSSDQENPVQEIEQILSMIPQTSNFDGQFKELQTAISQEDQQAHYSKISYLKDAPHEVEKFVFAADNGVQLVKNYLDKIFKQKSSEKLEPKEKNGDDHDQIKGTCSSYTDGDAKPQSLRITLPSHSTHYFKSVVNRVFFEGFETRFENESFNTMSGVSRFLDPCHLQEMFYKYYLSERERSKSSDCQSSQDAQFEEFCEMKLYSFLWTLLPHEDQCNTKRVKVSYLEGQPFGGPELVSTFRTAAKTVWLFHKLAFSFESPATIFRVLEGAEVDTKYMESTIVKVEDNERFVSKVGFMVDPGLRLNGEIIMRCDVYLAAPCTSTTAGNSPN
ncbi:unnamed protein product [Calypogeia fissa]